MRPLLFSVPACGFCLQVQSRSRGVKESRGWEANRRPSLSGCGLGRLWAIPGLPDSSISRPWNLASGPGDTTPKKHKINTNEASMLLKTQVALGKRTQNELKNEPNLRCLGRELKPNSEVARLKGKKPLTWLATLATLSPGKRAADEVWSETRSNARECKNRGNKARTSMKTKDKYKKSLSRAVSVQTPAARPRAAGRKAAADSSGSGLLYLSIAKIGGTKRECL